MVKIIIFIFIIIQIREVDAKNYLEKLAIKVVHLILVYTILDKQEILVMKNFYKPMDLMLRFTLLENFMHMRKQGKVQLLMEKYIGLNQGRNFAIQFA